MSKYEEKLAKLAREQMEKLYKDSANKNESNLSNSETEDTPKLRTRLKSNSVDLMELEEISEQGIKSFRSRNTRNKALIAVLAILLFISVVTISILLVMTYFQNNTFLYVHGGVKAVYLVDGEEINKFRTPTEIQGNRCLDVDILVKMKESGKYNVRYIIEVYQGDTRLENVIARNYDKRFTEGENGVYVSDNPIEFKYNDTITICDGILFDAQYEDTLNIENFHMEIHVYFERV